MGDKPFSIALRETREKLVEILNASGLPIDVIDMVLGEIRTVVHAQAEQEHAKQLETYRNEVEHGKPE